MSSQRNVSANEHTLNIKAGIPTLKTRYGLVIDEFDYLDIAVDLLRDMNTFGTTDYLAFLDIDKVGNALLPCNLHCIDALVTRKMGLKNFNTRQQYDTHRMSNTDSYFTATAIMQSVMPSIDPVTDRHPGIAHPSQVQDHGRLGHGQTTEGYAYKTPNGSRFLENEERYGYITYNLVDGKKISVDSKFADTTLALAYTGISVDPEGFPLITRRQSNAIAASAAKYILTAKAYKGDQGAANSLSFATQESGRLFQAACLPENITDNEWDTLFDAKTSFNRKSHKRPSKYSR